MRRGVQICAVVLLLPAATASATPGDLDPTFSRDGYTQVEFGKGARATAIAVDPQGRIVAAGTADAVEGEPPTTIAVARLTADGRLDPTFAGDGRAEVDVGPFANVRDVALDPSGRIVLGGSSGGDLIAVRLLADGSPDTAFSLDGIARADAGGSESGGSMVLAADGRPTVGGGSCSAGACRFALARFDLAGAPDPGFDGDGIVVTSFPGDYAVINDLASSPDGGLRAAGDTRVSYHEVALAQYTASGALDPSFNGGGQAVTSADTQGARSIAFDSAGRLLGVGEFGRLYRLTADGGVDPTFARTYQPRGGRFVIDSNQRAVIAGVVGGCYRGCTPVDTVLARVDAATGAVDPDFGGSYAYERWAAADLGAGPDGAFAVAVDGSDRPLTAGYAGDDMVVARFEDEAGPRDPDGDGIVGDADACPLRFSHREDGCPLNKRKLTLRRRAREDLWVGRVKSRLERCNAGRTVRVLRKRPGPNELTTKAVTDDDGRWSAEGNLRHGTYYARVEGFFSDRYGTCTTARSHAVTIGR